MPPTLRDLLLSKVERRYALVEIPEYGVKVGIRSLTEKERSAYEMESLNAKGADFAVKLENARRRLVILVAVDPETKQPLFKPLDSIQLESVDSAITSQIYDAAVKHCGFRSGDIEDLVKNSNTTAENTQPAS